jgi:hypothetical protein
MAVVEQLLGTFVSSDVAAFIVRDMNGAAHPCAVIIEEAVRQGHASFLKDSVMMQPNRCDLGRCRVVGLGANPSSEKLCGYACPRCQMMFCVECVAWMKWQRVGRTICQCPFAGQR